MKIKCLSLFFLVHFGIYGSSQAILTSVGLDKKQFTSDFMMGSVVVSIIFPESTGQLDSNKEDWSPERKSQVLSEIISGLDWWTKQNPSAALQFTYVTENVDTKYEPITRPYYDESLWIPDVMKKLGYLGDRFSATRAYINDLRTTYGTDWGYVIFVVDSLNDTNGKFSDGLFAYAYLGGPFVVMTYDNNGYGISNMDVVIAHETGHIFHALDQYAGASSPNDYSHGYFQTINGNHAYSGTANDPNSVMRGGIRWGLDRWAKEMIGWKDSDNNNHADIMEASPQKSILSQPSSSAVPSGGIGFSGQANVSIVPRQNNSNGWGFTVDTISNVEYRIQGDDWISATASDGAFDEPAEDYDITIPPSELPQSSSNVSAQDVDVRVVTSFATKSSGGLLGGTGSSGLLAQAHPYPNPFKPNSQLGHNNITFSNLTPGAKISIFTVGGDPVISIKAAPLTTTANWDTRDDNGKSVASGVYMYLITNDAGQKKEGKLAIIR